MKKPFNIKDTEPETDPAVQFPEIERILQTEDFDRINKSFSAAYEALENKIKGQGGLGKSKEARKAMKAIERIMDLLRDLLKLKYQLPREGGLESLGEERGHPRKK